MIAELTVLCHDEVIRQKGVGVIGVLLVTP
jgi:hypothetical protein